MKPKRHRPISNLYHAYIKRFGLTGALTSDDAVLALEAAGLVEVTERDRYIGLPTKYAETAKMRAAKDWPFNVLKVLIDYSKKVGRLNQTKR